MKKAQLLFLISSLLLPSCNNRQERVITFTSPFAVPQTGDGVIIEDDMITTPFHTQIQASYYTYYGNDSNEKIAEMKKDFEDEVLYYHALCDSHYSYSKDGKNIINIKYLNNHKDEKINLDPFLFKVLKEAFTFSKITDGRYHLFLGQILDIYEKKYDSIETYLTLEDEVLSNATHLSFNRFTTEEKDNISDIVHSLPKTDDEFSSLLEFDDENCAVTFFSHDKTGKDYSNLKISLGGCGKGFATEEIAKNLKDKYPDISLVLNSGTSSIKAIGTRPDQKDWSIRYFNPVYKEYKGESPYNENEIVLTHKGEFNLSTSGSYENYFYEYNNHNYIRRDHIISPSTGYSLNTFDQVSIMMNHTGYADMFTTAIMNTKDKDEAVSLFNKIKEYYSFDADLILSYKEGKDSNILSYPLTSYQNMNQHNLPLATLKDGREYNGDYSDIQKDDILSLKTVLKPDFVQVYYVSDNLYSKLKINPTLKHPCLSKIECLG